MRILVATSDLQGQRRSDFCWTEEGELVIFPMMCDGNDAIDGGCGCQRALAGADSRKATTTVKVIDADMSEQEYTKLVFAAYRQSGWSDDEITQYRLAEELQATAAIYEAGTVLERRGPELTPRERGAR